MLMHKLSAQKTSVTPQWSYQDMQKRCTVLYPAYGPGNRYRRAVELGYCTLGTESVLRHYKLSNTVSILSTRTNLRQLGKGNKGREANK